MEIPDSTHDSNTLSSSFKRTVSLHDWWLIKSEKEFNGRKLAVAGFSSSGTTGGRIFLSAPIAKRFDLLNIETADGITVFIRGCINKIHTLEHGISSEVSHCFLIGFPYNWEDFSYDCGEGFTSAKFLGQSNEHLNLKVGESTVNTSHAKPNDADANPLRRNNENLEPSDIELHKTENISTETGVGAEVGSNSSKKSLRSSSTRLSISDILRERLVSNRLDVDCVTPPRENMEKSEKTAHLPLSPLERVKYLNKRVNHMCSSERKNMKTSVLASKHSNSAAADSSRISGVDHINVTGEVSRESPNDAPELLPNDLKRDNATADASKCLMDLGSGVDGGSKNSTRQDTSKVVTAGRKVDNVDDSTSSLPVRRSKRLKK